jgi:hypothetical protein
MGAMFSENTTDVAGLGNTIILNGWKAGLKSATPMGAYLTANTNPLVHCIYDPVDATGTARPGRIWAWTSGGKCLNNESPPASPPISLPYTHQFTFQAITSPVFVEIPVRMLAGQACTFTVYMKKSANGMTVTPTVSLVDAASVYGATALNSATMTDNTSWQTLTVTYTPVNDTFAALRVAGTNASGTLDWFAVQSVPAGGGLMKITMNGGIGQQ